MLPLTKRQREILDYLNDFIQQHGYAPSLEEIGRRFGLSSLATVHKHLTNLEEKGFIKRAWNRSRSVELVPTRLGSRALELPLLGYVAAGAPIEAVVGNETIAVPEDLVGKRDSYVLRVRGDSMIDEQIRDGDYVIVEDRRTADNGEMVIALAQRLRRHAEEALSRAGPRPPAAGQSGHPADLRGGRAGAGPGRCRRRDAPLLTAFPGLRHRPPICRPRRLNQLNEAKLSISVKFAHGEKRWTTASRSTSPSCPMIRARRPHLRQLLRDFPYPVRLHALLLRSAAALRKRHPAGAGEPCRARTSPRQDRRAAPGGSEPDRGAPGAHARLQRIHRRQLGQGPGSLTSRLRLSRRDSGHPTLRALQPFCRRV